MTETSVAPSLLSAPRLVRASVAVAATQLVATIVSLVAERNGNDTLLSATSVIHMVLFVGGSVAFFLGFLKGLGRSRTEELSVAGLFFLAGPAAPAADRRTMQAALGVQVVTGIVGASLAPLTAVAFTCLSPTAGFGCLALYGSFLGAFADREIDSRV